MNTLRVRLPPLADLGAESGLDFEIIDGERRVLQRGIAVPGALPRIARVELVIAAPDVIMIDAALPRLSGARLRAALPKATSCVCSTSAAPVSPARCWMPA